VAILLASLLVPTGAAADGPDATPSTSPTAERSSAELPPVECVRLLRQARIDHLAGDTAAELDALHAAAERFPDEVDPAYSLLVYARDHGLPEDERQRFEERLGRRLDDLGQPLPPALLQQVALDPETDESLIGRIEASVARRLARDPGSVSDSLLGLQADLQQRLGKDADAAATLTRLWRRTGDTDTAWRLIHLDLGLERWSDALEVMESSDELKQELWITRLHLLTRTGALEEALALLDRQIDQVIGPRVGDLTDPGADTGIDTDDKTSAGLLEELAWSFRDAGRDAEAETLFRRALDRAPGDPQLEAVLLHLYSSDAERQEHAEQVARSWAEERNPQALLNEGTRRLTTGDAEGALDLLVRAAPAFPNLEAPWFNLGMAAYRLERWSRVVEALGVAAQLNPDRAASFFFRGVALTHLERCGEAVDDLEQALALDPKRTQAHYYLAGCYRDLGRPEDAAREQALYETSTSH